MAATRETFDDILAYYDSLPWDEEIEERLEKVKLYVKDKHN